MKVFGFNYLLALILIVSISSIESQNSMTPLSELPIGVCAYYTSDFGAIAKLGIKWIRFGAKTEYIEEARKYGIEVLPLLAYGYTDLSNNTDSKAPPLPQHRTTWALRKLNDLKNLTQPPKVLEVWNEPWHRGFYPPNPNATDYLELVKALAKEAWKIWPNVTILISADTDNFATSGVTNDYRKQLLQADTDKFLADPRILPTVHNYVEGRTPTQVTSKPCSWDFNRYECAYDDFKKHGHPDPKVWITEFGWESRSPDSYSLYGNITEANQTRYLTDSFDIMRKSGKVAASFVYMYRANDRWSFNLIYANGTYKPAALGMRDYIETNTPKTSTTLDLEESSTYEVNFSTLNPSSIVSSGACGIFIASSLLVFLLSFLF